MPKRSVPLPDFRCVYLTPGSPGGRGLTARQWRVVGAVGLALGLGSLVTQGLGAFAVVALAGSALAFRAAATRLRAHGAEHAQAPMVILPWGVVVDPEYETRILHWAAVREVSVQEKHVLRGGTPRVVSSRVTVRTRRERLRGSIGGTAGLEHLSANLRRYADEAARPIAADLDGRETVVDSGAEPVVEQLVSRARALCSTGEGAVRLGLPAGSYRQAALPSASAETTMALRAILSEGASAAATSAPDDSGVERGATPDPRPLAAVVAAHLGATALVPDLLRLSSAPHPVVAAVATACALRLGATPNRAGTLDEVAQFIRDDDLVALREWARGPDAVLQAA